MTQSQSGPPRFSRGPKVPIHAALIGPRQLQPQRYIPTKLCNYANARTHPLSLFLSTRQNNLHLQARHIICLLIAALSHIGQTTADRDCRSCKERDTPVWCCSGCLPGPGTLSQQDSRATTKATLAQKYTGLTQARNALIIAKRLYTLRKAGL